jgi:hypothetical protein
VSALAGAMFAGENVTIPMSSGNYVIRGKWGTSDQFGCSINDVHGYSRFIPWSAIAYIEVHRGATDATVSVFDGHDLHTSHTDTHVVVPGET